MVVIYLITNNTACLQLSPHAKLISKSQLGWPIFNFDNTSKLIVVPVFYYFLHTESNANATEWLPRRQWSQKMKPFDIIIKRSLLLRCNHVFHCYTIWQSLTGFLDCCPVLNCQWFLFLPYTECDANWYCFLVKLCGLKNGASHVSHKKPGNMGIILHPICFIIIAVEVSFQWHTIRMSDAHCITGNIGCDDDR